MNVLIDFLNTNKFIIRFVNDLLFLIIIVGIFMLAERFSKVEAKEISIRGLGLTAILIFFGFFGLVSLNLSNLITFIGIIYGLIYLVKLYKEMKIKKDSKEFKKAELAITEIKNKLGEKFDYELYKKFVFDNYKALQLAINNATLENVKQLLSDTMFDSYMKELENLNNTLEQNIMEDINYKDCFITEITNVNEKINIKTILIITCKNYVIDKTTKKVLRGKAREIKKNYYELTYTKPSLNEVALHNNLNNLTFNDYLLTNKKMISQSIIK